METTTPVVNIEFDRPQLLSAREELEKWTQLIVAKCLEDKGLPNAELSIQFCSRAAIKRLNTKFLDEEKPTDVLSFPATEKPGRFPKKARFYLGDIAICLPVCAAQAPEFGRSIEDETALMMVHGLLHLLGMDHDTEKKKAAMWAETDRLLKLVKRLRKPKLIVKGVNG